MKRKVSIIVCAYNEEENVEYVVRTLHKYTKVADLIVVDDGSDDRTPEILKDLQRSFSYKYIRLPENTGKSNALVVGVENAVHEILLFFDADVKGIRRKHIASLVNPLFMGEADMVLGTPSDTLIDYKVNPFRSLTGERALFRKGILPILEDIRDLGFGLETYINLYYQAHGRKIRYTKLEGLAHPSKYGKSNAIEATKDHIIEGSEIAEVYAKNFDLLLKRLKKSFKDEGKLVDYNYKKAQEEFYREIRKRI